MTSTAPTTGALGALGHGSLNRHQPKLKRRNVDPSLITLWQRLGPYLVSSVLLLLGYLHYAPGAAYSLSAEHYRAWAFPAFRYSDIIWLYLRDGLDRRPIPYVDFPLEYPPLTGLLTWVFSWSSDLPTYFALSYLTLAFFALLAVWALRQMSGANVWLFAASPALFFYTGHQWDMAAIGMAALGLLALQRSRDEWGMAALVVATSLKLFPVAFVAALIVERVRDRRFHSASGIALAFAAGTAAINAPVALANFDGWSFFFRWNRDRLADSGIWVLWRGVPTDDLTRWSLVAAIAGGIAITMLALRTRGSLFIPLGATYLLWWLLVNKTFTTHLMLWAILSLALLSAPWWLWGLTMVADSIGFQLGNYLNLYNVPEFEHSPLIRKAVENIYDPVQIGRSAVLLICALWGIHVLRLDRLRIVCASKATGNKRTASIPTLVTEEHSDSTPLTVQRRLTLALGLTLCFGTATVVMTWPYAQHLSTATIVGFDPFLQIWITEWIQHIALTDPLRLYDANVFYPFTQTLAYTDANIPGAIIAAPVRWLTGDPVLTNSLLVLASFVLAAAGVYALVVYLSGNRGAGCVAGLAYAFLPYRMVHLWHLNWLEGGLIPLVILALLRVIERPTPGRAVALGALMAALTSMSFYFSLQLAIVCSVVVAAAWTARRSLPSQEFLKAITLAVLLAVAVVVPIYVPYLNVREEQGLERTIVDAEQYKALPDSYLQVPPWDPPNPVLSLLGVRPGPNESLTEVGQAEHPDGHQHAEIVIEDALYPGAIMLLFAAVGVLTRMRRWWIAVAFAIIAIVAFVLSLGPTLGPREGTGLALPYGWLFDHTPLFRSMRVPARLGGLTDLMIVLLGGMGIAQAWNHLGATTRLDRFGKRSWVGPILTTILASAVMVEFWTGGVPLEDVDRGPEASAAAVWFASQPPGPIMEFPAESVFADPAAASIRRHYGESMFWSALHWDPLVNGNSGFIPRAYSDFIERFVGELSRPDGTMTPRLSHVDRGTAHLLSQIGVRYLVFHRSQYHRADWQAVFAELEPLAEEGIVKPAGEQGESTIFILNPAVPAVQAPDLRLYAPSLITPQSKWTPWVAIESRSDLPNVFSLTKLPYLETTWYDVEGKLLWRGMQRVPLPVILDEPRLLCSAAGCLTSRPFGDLSRLPPPDPVGSWNPGKKGHYVVRLRLTGDHPVECTVDLDLVDGAGEVWKRAGANSYRWAECNGSSPNPVNNPGALPFLLGRPSVTLLRDTAYINMAVTPRANEELQGWFILAPPGEPEPWNASVYQSLVQQKLLNADSTTWFDWTAPIGTSVEPGIYELTVWFHRRGSNGWEHAAGGNVGLAPIVVGDDHTLRWAGPISARLATPTWALASGAKARLELSVHGASDPTRCSARWRLFAGSENVASGNAGQCAEPEIALPADIPLGHYRLQVEILINSGKQPQLSDAFSIPVTVHDNRVRGAPR